MKRHPDYGMLNSHHKRRIVLKKEFTKEKFLDVFFYIDKSDWEDVEYAKSRRKDAEIYLTKLFKSEREEEMERCIKEMGLFDNSTQMVRNVLLTIINNIRFKAISKK